MNQLEDLLERCKASIDLGNEEGHLSRKVQEERREIIHDYCIAYASKCEELTRVEIIIPDHSHIVHADTINDIRCHLGALKEKLDHDVQVAHANAGTTNVSNTATSTASATALMSVDFKQTVEAVEKLPESKLSDEDKDALLGMLSRLEGATEKSDHSAKDKAAKIIKWLGDKSVDVMVAVAPVVMRSLMGQ